jgi:predicted RND superfamily exporter protein
VVAFFGVLLVVAVTVGVGLHGVLTAASAVLGTLAMLALASLAGLKVNFLDFVALPLTMGIGTDYAANVLLRAKEEGRGGARRALLTTGGAVLLCSFTTVVGYGSLLVSDNAGIRSFGTAAIFGEITCMAAGILVGLVLLDRWDARRRPRPVLIPPPGPEAAPVPVSVLKNAVDQGRELPHASHHGLPRYIGKRS